MATAVAAKPKEQGGMFRILVGAHIGDGPKGCECDDCLKTGGKGHVYRERRVDRVRQNGMWQEPDPPEWDGDIIDSPKVDLELRHNHGPYSRKFERIHPGAQSVTTPPPVALEKLTLAQLFGVAADEEIDLKGASKKDDVIKIIRAAKPQLG